MLPTRMRLLSAPRRWLSLSQRGVSTKCVSRLDLLSRSGHPLRMVNTAALASNGPSLAVSPLTGEDYGRMVIESRVYDVALETPLQEATNFSALLNNRVFFKREDMQPIFSFKIRGAYNKIAHLTEQQKVNGIVCCSAGNHAQGVAMSARKLGIQAKIVMPLATPEIKVKAVRQHGGPECQIVLHGNTYDEAAAEAKRIERTEKKTMILPFDEPYVIAGQGTIGMEILRETSGKPLDAIFVCCGGGGMLAGIAAWVKQFRPEVKVIGVEAADAAGMTQSLMAGHRVELDHVGLFADGAAVKLVGEETFRVCQQYVDEMITVSTNEICQAIKTAFNDTRVILEPAGALAIAGVRQYVNTTGVTGCTFAVTTSGANTDFDRLRFVSERADYRETLISVEILERPGAFHQLHQLFHEKKIVVSEFSYRYSLPDRALIYMSFQSSTRDEAKSMLDKLSTSGYSVENLTENELAKDHTRHLAGGKSPNVTNEILYRFEFPERFGALWEFLNCVNIGWNISLFHYRNHGADVGRVLVGFQVPEHDRDTFQQVLNDLGYEYVEETNNPVYRKFLL